MDFNRCYRAVMLIAVSSLSLRLCPVEKTCLTAESIALLFTHGQVYIVDDDLASMSGAAIADLLF